MAGYVQPGYIFILLSLITNAFFAAALTEPENENTIVLPSEGTTRGSSVCNEKHESVSCPVNCFRPDPVCGVDGITYWCGCADAQCAGAEVAKIGFCEVGNGGSGLLSGQALLLERPYKKKIVLENSVEGSQIADTKLDVQFQRELDTQTQREQEAS